MEAVPVISELCVALEKTCAFCHKWTNDPVQYGDFRQTEGIFAHYFCVVSISFGKRGVGLRTCLLMIENCNNCTHGIHHTTTQQIGEITVFDCIVKRFHF